MSILQALQPEVREEGLRILARVQDVAAVQPQCQATNLCLLLLGRLGLVLRESVKGDK